MFMIHNYVRNEFSERKICEYLVVNKIYSYKRCVSVRSIKGMLKGMQTGTVAWAEINAHIYSHKIFQYS